MSLNSSQEPLLASQKRSLTSSLTISKLNDPIQQYNHVIRCYNFPENQVDGAELEELGEFLVYKYFWKIFSNTVYLILFSAFILVPAMGVVIYGWVVSAMIFYLNSLRTFRRNQKKVDNPFKNMVFSPELCKITKTTNKFYEIKVQDLEGFSFNSEVLALLKVKENQGTIRFMVYNTMFWSYYHNFESHRTRHVLTLLVATFLLAVQMVFIDLLIRLCAE